MSVSGRTYHAARKRGFLPDWQPQARTRALLGQVEAVLDEYAEHLPLTARQVFYRLIGRFRYPKDERAYERLLNAIANARRARVLPFNAIRDDGVTESLPRGFDDVADFWAAVRSAADGYRRNRLAAQPLRVEVWGEAAGMVPQLARVAHEWGVAVYSSGGFDSLTAKYDAAKRIAADSRLTVILHVGDLDPSGAAILDSAAEDVAAFVAELGGRVRFERVAVTPEQVEHFGLPTAPAKATDRRGGDWSGGTVQAEALPPDELARALRGALESVLDADALDEICGLEARERAELSERLAALPARRRRRQ